MTLEEKLTRNREVYQSTVISEENSARIKAAHIRSRELVEEMKNKEGNQIVEHVAKSHQFDF